MHRPVRAAVVDWELGSSLYRLLALIVGAIGRCCDFDRCFNALRPHLRRAVTAIRRAFPDGAVPAIDVVKLGDEYFVSDGHKRIAAAAPPEPNTSTPT